jgi:hypothetical protein
MCDHARATLCSDVMSYHGIESRQRTPRTLCLQSLNLQTVPNFRDSATLKLLLLLERDET